MTLVSSIWPIGRPNFAAIALALFACLGTSSTLADLGTETAGKIEQQQEQATKSDFRSAQALEDMHQPVPLENRITTPDENSMIYFPDRSMALADSEKEKLYLYVEYLKQNPKKAVALIGRSDDLGSRSYDLAIAEERTIVVSDLLRSYGVAARQIRRYCMGNEKKPTPCQSKECKQSMRRVEVVLVP